MRENLMSYPDVSFEYTGAIGSRHAVIEPSGDDEYAIFDSWMNYNHNLPCVGFAKIDVLAPIIFADWRN